MAARISIVECDQYASNNPLRTWVEGHDKQQEEAQFEPRFRRGCANMPSILSDSISQEGEEEV